MNPVSSPSNIAQPLMQNSIESTTQSPDTSASGRPRVSNGKLLCAHGMVAACLGSFTVFATRMVSLKLNQSTNDFLYNHCFNDMAIAEAREYKELSTYTSDYFADFAITTTALFIASGGLTPLYNAGKSIYDRVCSCFRAPDPAVNQSEEV